MKFFFCEINKIQVVIGWTDYSKILFIGAEFYFYFFSLSALSNQLPTSVHRNSITWKLNGHSLTDSLEQLNPSPFLENKVSLQTSLVRNFSNFSYILFFFFFFVNFENLTVEFHVSYVLNMHIKFRSNWILFTIQSIKLFCTHNW